MDHPSTPGLEATPDLEERDEFWIARSPSEARPAVSVVIPSFRAEATLGRAVQSVLRQTLDDIEVIVVDDASDDGSWELILGLQRQDPRVFGIRHKRNCGKPIAMNRAVRMARGRWLAILDADDWYHPDRLAALVAIGERHRADLVADNQYFFDTVADRTVGTAWSPADTRWPLSFDDFLRGSEAYLTFNFGMLKPIVRLDFIRRTELAYEEEARNGQDFFYLLQFYLHSGRAVVADQPYYYYVQPFGRESRQWSHARRRRYDFQTACRINRQYVAAARPILTRGQAQRLRRRSRHLEALEIFFRVREDLAARNPFAATARLLGCPSALGYTARRLYARIAGAPGAKIIGRVVDRARRARPGQAAGLPVSSGASRVEAKRDSRFA